MIVRFGGTRVAGGVRAGTAGAGVVGGKRHRCGRWPVIVSLWKGYRAVVRPRLGGVVPAGGNHSTSPIVSIGGLQLPRREEPTMGERMLRGSRLGAVSYESDRNTELAPRQNRDYVCARNHRFTVPFAVDAEIPMTWECKFDGTVAKLVDGEEPEQKKQKPPRTHWDMLLERRSVGELEDILAERLQELRARRGRTA